VRRRGHWSGHYGSARLAENSLPFSSKLKIERSQKASYWGGDAVAMSKYLLDNSAMENA
jgi:hypothetical protein